MPRSPDARSADRNLLLAVGGLVVIAGGTALACALICDFTLEAFRSTTAMAALLTADGSIIMDDKTTEAHLARATASFRLVKDLAWSVAVGSLGLGVVTLVRLHREKAATGQPEG